jgi:hypothetical protein
MKQAPPRQIFKTLLIKNAIIKPKIEDPWQFCPKNLDPPPGILSKI